MHNAADTSQISYSSPLRGRGRGGVTEILLYRAEGYDARDLKTFETPPDAQQRKHQHHVTQRHVTREMNFSQLPDCQSKTPSSGGATKQLVGLQKTVRNIV